MATINFLYRSTKSEANLNLRLLFRHEGKDFVYSAKTRYKTTKEYWSKTHSLKRINDAKLKNTQSEVNTDLNEISKFIIQKFEKRPKNTISKKWLENTLIEFYNPTREKEALPEEIILYIDIFTASKKNDLKPRSLSRYNVIKKMLERFQEFSESILLIKDIDTNFKVDFENYCIEEGYSKNTIIRAIRAVKTICNHAKNKGIETSKELSNIEAKYKKVQNIYLNEKDIKKLETLPEEALPEYLNNAKDWLLISCYTGQRISDFMRFNSKMIRMEANKEGVLKPFIEFTQVKTDKVMIVPLHPKVMAILDKRNGEFPRRTSDPNYNNYIKAVCKIANIQEIVSGSKKVLYKEDANGRQFRKQEGQYPKYELVASHIGRRSFATNNYGTIPTTYIMKMTGHSTEATLLQYIGKSNKDFAMDIMEYFE